MKRAQEQWKNDLVEYPKRSQVIRGWRDLLYNPKVHGVGLPVWPNLWPQNITG